jgi:hypothetical protein
MSKMMAVVVMAICFILEGKVGNFFWEMARKFGVVKNGTRGAIPKIWGSQKCVKVP